MFNIPVILLTTNSLWRNLINGLIFFEQVPNNYFEFGVFFPIYTARGSSTITPFKGAHVHLCFFILISFQYTQIMDTLI